MSRSYTPSGALTPPSLRALVALWAVLAEAPVQIGYTSVPPCLIRARRFLDAGPFRVTAGIRTWVAVMTDLVAGFERPLGEKEVADLLGVSPNTLKHWRWVGKGPRYVKLVSKVAYRQQDLDDWINANVTEPGPA